MSGTKMLISNCRATLKNINTGATIRCEGMKDHETTYGSPHSATGFEWVERKVTYPGLFSTKSFRVEGLWLTNGERIVKPGHGEYASEQGNDILLLSVDEMERGISLDEFKRRLSDAVQKQQRWHKKQGKRWAKMMVGQ